VRRKLSSELTFFMKVIFPTVWIGGIAGTTVMMVCVALDGGDGKGGVPAWMACLTPCFLAVAMVIAYRTVIRLKAVAMDDEALYVSNFLTEARIPLSEIQVVEQEVQWMQQLNFYGFNMHPVTVTIVRPCVFGTSIPFLAGVSFSRNLAAEKVEQIRQAVAAARLTASMRSPVLDGGASSDAITTGPGGVASSPPRTEISTQGPGAIRREDGQR
jgi:hypothetical protein